MDALTCRGPECEKPSRRQGLCWGHARQKQRGERLKPLAARKQTGKARILEAARIWADAEDNAAYIRAEARLLSAAMSYARPILCTVRYCGRRRYAGGMCWKHFWGRTVVHSVSTV